MKKLALVLAFALVSGLALAGETKPAADTKAAPKAAVAKSHDVDNVEVVSVDAAKKTITVKMGPENHTATCEGKAVDALKTTKAGDKISLTCRDNEKGEHQAITAIKPMAAPAAPAVKK